jgi:hypothetical protein
MKKVNTIPGLSITTASLMLIITLTACGRASILEQTPLVDLPPIGSVGADGIVSKSRATITVNTVNQGLAQKMLNHIFPVAFAASGQQQVTIVNAANVAMTLDASQWFIPTINSAPLDFGNLSINSLQDNNLSVCGSNGKQKCNNAVIRIYTSGQTGAGVWNSVDGYGMPITAALVNTVAVGTVGLNSANSVTLQTQAISSNTHVLRQTDFTVTPKYNVKSDFTNAGAGTYSTTVVIDYGLSI